MEFNDFLLGFADLFDDTDPATINANTHFKELDEWSSLSAMGLIALVKTQFNKSLKGSEILHCNTVKELFDYIVSK